MKRIKLCETEVIESNRVVEFPDGPVTICEREVHEHYEPVGTRLIISDAIDVTRDFVAKARAEFAELNCLMRELVTR